MSKIEKFSDFSPKTDISAGIIIVLKNEKILLCHPTKSKWIGTYSFPKGGVEKDESIIDAAMRECFEETSIIINPNKISNINNPIIVDYINKKGIKYKKVYLYVLYIDDISEIGLDSEIIPKENLERIFEPFFSTHTSKGKALKGRGLGLSLVFRIIREHLGNIQITSKIDIGTTFTINIPFLNTY